MSNKGYAIGFDETLKYIEALLPSQEAISDFIPYLCLNLRIIIQFFCITPNSDIVNLFKSNRLHSWQTALPIWKNPVLI